METFTRNWPFVRGIHRFPMNSPHKGQWRGALMFSLICVWINGWVNNREVGDLRRYRAHSDVTVMYYLWWVPGSHRLVGGRATCLTGWHISARKQRGKVSAQLITLFAQLALCGGDPAVTDWASMLSVISAWTKCYINSDLRRHNAHNASLWCIQTITARTFVSRLVFCSAWWRHQIETFYALLARCEWNPRVTGGFCHKGQWRGALMFYLICAWVNG